MRAHDESTLGKTRSTGAEDNSTQKTLSTRGFSSENCSLSLHNRNRSESNSSALIRVMIEHYSGIGFSLQVLALKLRPRPW